MKREMLMIMKNKNLIWPALFGFVVSALAGFLIGLFCTNLSGFGKSDMGTLDPQLQSYYESLIGDEDATERGTTLERIKQELSAANIRQHLKYLTSIPKLAGTLGDRISAEYVLNQWRSYGLDQAQILDYDVLLDYSHPTKFNNVEIRDASNTVERTVDISETIYDKDLDYTNISKPYLALGTNGSITSDRVYYANFCDVKDFELLANQSMNVSNSIVICRYGSIFRGNKIMNGQLFGARAVIIFDDPIRAAPFEVRDKIYPNGEFLPSDGVQRGSINLKEGDPLTPIYPSVAGAYRIRIEESKTLLKIPGQVIGYGLAEQIFRLFDVSASTLAPQSWRGQMNASYVFGGPLVAGRSLTLNVFNERRVANINNVVGIIEGSFEPDRYVMVGNHRDAWTFGSVDPSTGTSTMLEISRMLMSLKKRGLWRPRRSIVFLSWSAEEFGSQGSTEWVEEYLKRLAANGVVYINMDNILKGNYSLTVKASPLFFDMMYSIAKRIDVEEGVSVFKRWAINEPSIENSTIPYINPLMGSGTDHLAFLQRAGVPCIDQRFIRDNKDPVFLNIIGSFPLYHSSYETFNLVTKFLDPEFKTARTMGIIAAETLHTLAGRLVLPFNCATYGKQLRKEMDKFKSKYGARVAALNVSLDVLDKTVDEFKRATILFQKSLDSIDRTQIHQVRKVNDQMRSLERAFLDPSTLEQNGYTHMLFAPSSFNKYGAYSFPTLVEAIYLNDRNKTVVAHMSIQDTLRKRLSIVVYTIRSAIYIIKDPIDFARQV